MATRVSRRRTAPKRNRGRPCTVCAHPSREAIDRALVNGEPDTGVSAKFRGITDDAVRRHRESHLPKSLVRARAAAEVARADSLLEQVSSLKARAVAILDRAEEAGDLRSALGGIREARGCLELLGRLEGELPDAPMVNLVLSVQWVELRGVILRALAPYAPAQAAVAAALDSYARN